MGESALSSDSLRASLIAGAHKAEVNARPLSQSSQVVRTHRPLRGRPGLYVCWTDDVDARLAMHNERSGGHYTQRRRPESHARICEEMGEAAETFERGVIILAEAVAVNHVAADPNVIARSYAGETLFIRRMTREASQPTNLRAKTQDTGDGDCDRESRSYDEDGKQPIT